ncbi:hypothetical protein [Streptomyces sp. NBC_01276]|uniref:hypothetical protein n=1 Tax=Streptomyces sp. NBC_01276 TaxID=2903808 RepID=UPI00352CEDBA
MIERRPLGTGPRPATPPAQPSAARRARLAAEGPEAAGPVRAGTADREDAARSRRILGPGNAADSG